MNERIKELAKQVEACYLPRYDNWQMDTDTMEKFAELIVKECINKVDEVGYKSSNNISSDDTELFKGVLKSHFGIKND